jgi:hypothetical protein
MNRGDLRVMPGPLFGCLPLRLLVFLHRFPLLLDLRFLLFVGRLLRPSRTVGTGKDLSFGRHRPCQTQQQYESKYSFHNVLRILNPISDLIPKLRRALGTNPPPNITPVMLNTSS